MIDEALKVITSTQIGTLATLLEDGAPYSTPITYTFADGVFSWSSSPDAVHSKNIARDARVSLSIFEPGDNPHAVYITSTAHTTGETSYNEQWGQTLEKYLLSIGEADNEHSMPGRFYYKEKAA